VEQCKERLNKLSPERVQIKRVIGGHRFVPSFSSDLALDEKKIEGLAESPWRVISSHLFRDITRSQDSSTKVGMC